MGKGTTVVLQGSALTLFGLLFLIFGLALAFFRASVSKGHRQWMGMTLGRHGREAAEAVTKRTWLAIGTLTAIMGAGLLFAGLNLLLRH